MTYRIYCVLYCSRVFDQNIISRFPTVLLSSLMIYFLALTLLLTNLLGMGERMPEKTLGRWRGGWNFSCIKRTNMAFFGKLGKLFLFKPAITCINISMHMSSVRITSTHGLSSTSRSSQTLLSPYKKNLRYILTWALCKIIRQAARSPTTKGA